MKYLEDLHEGLEVPLGSADVAKKSIIEFAGNSLTANVTVISAHVSERKPDRGLAKLEVKMANEDGKTVMTMIGNVIVGCSP